MDQPEMYQWCKIHQTWIILFLLKMTLQIVWYLFCISNFSLKLQITHYYLYMQLPLICIFNFLSLKAAFKMKTWKTCHYKIPLGNIYNAPTSHSAANTSHCVHRQVNKAYLKMVGKIKLKITRPVVHYFSKNVKFFCFLAKVTMIQWW